MNNSKCRLLHHDVCHKIFLFLLIKNWGSCGTSKLSLYFFPPSFSPFLLRPFDLNYDPTPHTVFTISSPHHRTLINTTDRNQPTCSHFNALPSFLSFVSFPLSLSGWQPERFLFSLLRCCKSSSGDFSRRSASFNGVHRIILCCPLMAENFVEMLCMDLVSWV